MENINFISNGKTGDLIHNLFAVKSLCEKENKKANLYITNNTKYGGDVFHYDIDKTYSDLEPIIGIQKYINHFGVLKNDDITNFINLNSWRFSHLFFQACWTNILTNLYEINPPNSNWLECESNKNDFVLLHRSTWRHTENFPWEEVIEKNNCKFITTDVNEYNLFKYKDKVDLQFCESFYEMVKEINSCKIFVGNMSTPLAIAHSLGIPHFAELYNVDQIHYVGEENYLKNYFYHKHNSDGYVDGLENFLNL